jgi:hypothetical protein
MLNRFGVLAAFVCVLMVICCSNQYQADENECPCEEGWKCCWNNCIPEEDQCSSDGGSNGGCPCMEGWKCCQETCIPDEAVCNEGSNRACACRDPRDVVNTDSYEFECYRKDYQCSALALCDAGYECDHNNRCICISLNLCGIECSGDCNCPEEFVCDPGTDTCRLPLICLDDSMCTNDYICRQVMGTINHYTCLPPDGKQVGENCLGSLDCNSSICHTNVCLQFCTKNADCPSGQYCSQLDLGEAGCVFQTECGSTCNAPDEFCGEHGHECMSNYCRTGADCAGDCGLHIDRPLLGQCLPVDFPEQGFCNDNEFVHTPFSNDGHCLIFKACWTDADCPSPYSCFSGDELGAPPPSGSGLCGRLK